jgi:hypothetical protein
MARVHEPTADEETTWREWVAERPLAVRAVAKRFDPWSLYRLKSSGHRVVICSFDEVEDGSVKLQVDVLGRYNSVAFERRVFGVSPDDLEPCDLPAAGEKLGAQVDLESMSEAERADFFKMVRKLHLKKN